jgi:putative membrane protein
MRALLHVVLNAVALWIAAHLVPGIHYHGTIVYLLVAGLVLGLLNLLVKPIVTFFSLPFIVLSLGLFYLVINGLILYLTSLLLPRVLTVDGCGAAILGGVVIALFNWLVHAIVSE